MTPYCCQQQFSEVEYFTSWAMATTKENLSSASFGGHDSKSDSTPKPFKTLKWGKKAQNLKEKFFSPINHVLADKSANKSAETTGSLESLEKSFEKKVMIIQIIILLINAYASRGISDKPQ